MRKSNSMHDQSSIASAALCPRRILLVEDNRDIVEPLAMLLRTQGHQVETAYDGKTGMKIAQKQQPEIAFLDIGIPEMNGFELAHQLRQHFSSEKLTLIALSGYDQKEQRIREAGFNDFLLKPVDLDKITTLLSKLD